MYCVFSHLLLFKKALKLFEGSGGENYGVRNGVNNSKKVPAQTTGGEGSPTGGAPVSNGE